LLYSIFALAFLLAALAQLGYAGLFLLARTRHKAGREEADTPVSVVICARNEAGNLQQFLPEVLQQDYPPHLWEVIVVDDGSTDRSAGVLQRLAVQYPGLRVIPLPPDTVKDLPGKKYALQQGIAAARFDRVLLTDADCRPASTQWLRTMSASGRGIILGYGAYEQRPGLLNRFIRWETAHTCMQYASYAAIGLPYMGVGRNLSYPKNLLAGLEEDAAFREAYTRTPSGDDDLLISRIARKDNVSVCLEKEAHTISIPQTSWKAWWRQKTRHSSTGKYYPVLIKGLLGIYGLSHGLYWLCGITILIAAFFAAPGAPASVWRLDGCLAVPNHLTLLLLALFGLRLLLYWGCAARWYRALRVKKLLLFYPLGDLGWALYNVFLSPYILWKNRKAWK